MLSYIKIIAAISAPLLVIIFLQAWYCDRLQQQIESYNRALFSAKAVAIEQTASLQAEIERITDDAAKQEQEHKKDADSLRSDLRNYAARMQHNKGCDLPNASGAANRADANKQRATDAGSLEDLIADTAERADEAARRLNACLTAYNTARDSINRHNKQ